MFEIHAVDSDFFDWLFDKDGLPRMDHQMHQPLNVADHNSNAIPIKELCVSAPTKSPGCHKAPSVARTSKFNDTLSKATKISNNIRQEDAKTLFDTVCRPSVEHTTPQTFMPKNRPKCLPNVDAEDFWKSEMAK